MEYLTLTDLQNRLTLAGLRYVGDRNFDGAVDADETAAYLQTAIAYAGNVIDGALCGHLDPARARGSGNGWLRDRAVDIAAWRAAGHGGRDVPPVLVDAYQHALAELVRVRAGEPIPGLARITPTNTAYTPHTPRVANFD